VGTLIRSLFEASPASVLKILTEPWRVRVRLTAPPVVDAARGVARLFPDINAGTINSLRLDLLRNHTLFREIDTALIEKRGRRVVCDEWKEMLHLLVRLRSPDIMVETGVFDGESSSIILQAMSDAGRGRLISIDLPAVETIVGSTHLMKETSLPPGLQPGWLVPPRLAPRHVLHLGDSRTLLPRILKEQPRIDIFFHDSLHTYEHQSFEYRVAWERLSEGGLPVSDDIGWNAAFHDFCRSVRRPYVRTALGRLGIARRSEAPPAPESS
jgi:predicted O-methyltransferase YrrM